jgi:hypothetical protein
VGEAKCKKLGLQPETDPDAGRFPSVIDLHMLPPVAAINGARIRELTGDAAIPISDTTQIVLQVFRSVVGKRTFHVGFCVGDETGVSAIGAAVIERLAMEPSDSPIQAVPVVHEDIAWDIVLRHLNNFSGRALLFAFPDSVVYDAGTAEMYYSNAIRLFDHEGRRLEGLTAAQRRKIYGRRADALDLPPPKLYAVPDIAREDTPWIFRLRTPAGKEVRTAVWNGRRDYAHELPVGVTRWVGGNRIAIAQVDRPVGVNLRSSLSVTHFLAQEFDGVIHWARDTETFQSILKSFVRLDLESVSPPALPEDWKPEVVILAANSA